VYHNLVWVNILKKRHQVLKIIPFCWLYCQWDSRMLYASCTMLLSYYSLCSFLSDVLMSISSFLSWPASNKGERR
jgi:hypothetical protein